MASPLQSCGNVCRRLRTTLPPDIESHLEDESLEVRMEKLLERCMAHYTNGSWDDGGALISAVDNWAPEDDGW